MKIFNKTSLIIAITAILTATTTSCKKYLVENPESALYPNYFSTPGGVLAGITGVYYDLRQNFFAGEGIVFFNQGTDEVVAGGSSTNPTGASYNGVNSSNSVGFSGLFTDINSLNGVLQYAPAANLDAATKAAYIAQAKFLRGWIYFFLVQTFGGTTATQQSGIPLHTTFLTEATTADAPAKLSDIYAQIIQDFTDAAAALPPTITATNPFAGGANAGKTATSAVANMYLAKAYLTRAYTEAAVVGDFQKAADLTAAIIANKGTYGLDLWQDYFDAHKPANDYGKENMFNIDFGGLTDPSYSGYVGQASGGNGLNLLYVVSRFNYVGPGVDNVAGIDAVPQVISTAKPGMLRDVFNGRPYIRIAPNPPYTINQAFADKVNDVRYQATFQTYWICNTTVAAGKTSTGGTKGQLIPASNVSTSSFQVPIGGDTAILMPENNSVTLAQRDAFKGLIVTPAQFTNVVFPTVKKFDDPTRLQTSDFSSRPIVLLRFSEVYLVNAEANYMLGNITNAANSLNVLRQRAAFRAPADANVIPKSSVSVTAATQAAVNLQCQAAMLLTPAQLAQLALPNNTTVGSPPCGMDLILDEYTRELYGDPRRWYDLVRTGQLVRRVKQYNAIAAPNIQPYHVRRPIPQSLIQAVSTGPAYPQNNGY